MTGESQSVSTMVAVDFLVETHHLTVGTGVRVGPLCGSLLATELDSGV